MPKKDIRYPELLIMRVHIFAGINKTFTCYLTKMIRSLYV